MNYCLKSFEKNDIFLRSSLVSTNERISIHRNSKNSILFFDYPKNYKSNFLNVFFGLRRAVQSLSQTIFELDKNSIFNATLKSIS